MKCFTLGLVALISLSAAAPRAGAQEAPVAAVVPSAPADSLEAAKTLYAAASYEDALAMLTRLGPAPENGAYAVFCLIALDRGPDAEKRIQEILDVDPLFAPNSEEASPRVQEMFDRVRTANAPRIARTLYADAKAAFDLKDSNAALKKFELLLQVIERTGEAESALLGELKLLATGYVGLAKAAALPAAPAATPAASESPVPANGAAVNGAADNGAPANGPVGTNGAGAPPATSAAVPLVEQFPHWSPGSAIARGLEFTGMLRLRISATGAVESAEIVEPIHPSYDRRLLDAAARWRYQPARKDGVAVASDRMVAVRLKQG